METILLSEEDDQFYNLLFANVDNGGSYPGAFTKKETQWLNDYRTGKTLHLFSGSSDIGDVRVDFAHPNANVHQDVFEFLSQTTERFDSVIIDAPYNKRFAEKYAQLSKGDISQQFIIFAQARKTTLLFNHLIALGPKRIILKSWNWYVVKGYHVLYSVLCYAGGYRKPTIFLVLEKQE